MACAVRQLVEERTVVLADAGILSKLRHGYAVAGGRIKGSVAVLDAMWNSANTE